MAATVNWTKTLALRPEVVASDGGVGDLQMSLHKAAYQTVDAPYRDVGYFADITQPTANLVGFLARVARRLGGGGESIALFHLDQGMGGGKSHALVALFHMANNPGAFFATDLGKAVHAEAQAGGGRVDLWDSRGYPYRRPFLPRQADRGIRACHNALRAVPVGSRRR